MGSCIGVDIGMSSIKIAEVAKRPDGSLHLTKAAIRYGSFDVNTTMEQRNQELALFLKRSREVLKIGKQRSVIVALPSASVFMRYVDMLVTKNKKDYELISLEAQQQIPLPLDEVAWDYRFTETQGKNKRALLVAVKQDVIQETQKMLSVAQVSSSCITLKAFGLLHMVSKLSAFRKSEGVVIVDIGAETTGIVISHGHHAWMRNISWGSRQLTNEIAQEAHIQYLEADTIKKTGKCADLKLSATAQAAIQDTIRHAIDGLAGEIERSWMFYKQEYSKTGRDMSEEDWGKYSVALTGGGSGLEGLAQAIEQKIKLTVVPLKPLHFLKVNRNALRKTHFDGITCEKDMCEEIAPLLSGAIGAAIYGLEKPYYRINFLRQESVRRTGQWMRSAVRILSYVLFFGAFGIHFFFQNAEITKNERRVEMIEKMAESMDTLGPQLDTIVADSERVHREGAIVRTYIEKRRLWLEVLTSVAAVLPAEVWIENFQGSGVYDPDMTNALVIQGSTKAYEHLNTFIAALKKQPIFTEVKPESVTNKGDEFHFLLNCKVQHAQKKEG